MKHVVVLEDAQILIPHDAHKNFTALRGNVIPAGTEIQGEEVFITGLKNGIPFTYRLFSIGDKKFIYLNKVQPKMNATEVKLGANGNGGIMYGANGASQSTVVDMKPAEVFGFEKIIGIGSGALLGYLYARKKQANKFKWMAIGAVVGYGIAYLIDSRHKATIAKK